MSLQPLDNLIRALARLPGLGRRSADRAALALVRRPDTLLDELAAALRATRAQAIVQGRAQGFELDVRDASYRGADGHARALPKGMQVSITSAKEDQASPTIGRIRFFPDGSSTGGHIVLAHGARRWRIDVAWLTGAVGVGDDAVVR
jgi:general secretion pathway protein H